MGLCSSKKPQNTVDDDAKEKEEKEKIVATGIADDGSATVIVVTPPRPLKRTIKSDLAISTTADGCCGVAAGGGGASVVSPGTATAINNKEREDYKRTRRNAEHAITIQGISPTQTREDIADEHKVMATIEARRQSFATIHPLGVKFVGTPPERRRDSESNLYNQSNSDLLHLQTFHGAPIVYTVPVHPQPVS